MLLQFCECSSGLLGKALGSEPNKGECVIFHLETIIMKVTSVWNRCM